jgi:hypothetical protein
VSVRTPWLSLLPNCSFLPPDSTTMPLASLFAFFAKPRPRGSEIEIVRSAALELTLKESFALPLPMPPRAPWETAGGFAAGCVWAGDGAA